jgi:tetratricopeptide (TPR) repeat protein
MYFMTTIKKSSIIILGVLILGTTQCAKQRSVTVNSIRPADIEVPSKIKTLLIVDRTQYDKKVIDVLESVLTGELPNEDKASVQFLTNAMRAELSGSPRFQIKLATERLSGNSLTSTFPEALSWSQIQRLCDNYEADALIAVEIFDTDFIVTNGIRKKKVTENGVEREVDEYYAQGVNNLKMGLRLYNPKTSQILDQQLIKESGTWNAAAASKAGAMLALINKADATHQLSSRIGADYAYRVSPMSVQITRSFRGKSRKAPELERGSRLADVGKWEEAIEVWEADIGSAKAKNQGYLSYNIAVAYEILGKMSEAREWASQSYTQYGNKAGAEYLRLLELRIANEQIANKQLQD